MRETGDPFAIEILALLKTVEEVESIFTPHFACLQTTKKGVLFRLGIQWQLRRLRQEERLRRLCAILMYITPI